MSPVITTVRPRARRPEDVGGPNDAAVRQCDRLTPLKCAAERAARHAERVGSGDVEPSRPLVLPQRVADRRRPVSDGEGLDAVVLEGDRLVRAELDDLERVRDPPDDHAQCAEQRARSARPEHGDRDLAPAQPERLQHAREPEHVIGVEMRQEDVLEVDEPDVGSEKLPLRPFAAVDEKAIPAAPDERRRRPTRGSRRGGGRSEEDEVEIHGGRS